MTQPITPTASLYDAGGLSFDVIIQNFIVGVTGLPGELVRPRWQPVEPVYPELDQTWCATGELSRDGQINTIARQNEFTMEVHRHEKITIMTSFLGPDADRLMSVLREGMTLEVNRRVLLENGMDVLQIGVINRAPTLVNSQWQDRFDMTWVAARHTSQVYTSPSVLTADPPVILS